MGRGGWINERTHTTHMYIIIMFIAMYMNVVHRKAAGCWWINLPTIRSHAVTKMCNRRRKEDEEEENNYSEYMVVCCGYTNTTHISFMQIATHSFVIKITNVRPNISRTTSTHTHRHSHRQYKKKYYCTQNGHRAEFQILPSWWNNEWFRFTD